MELNVMSFNIRCANDANGHTIAERAPRIKSIFEAYSPDLVGIQEFSPAWEQFFEEYLAIGYEMYYIPRDFNKNREATPLMWKNDKYECIEKKTFWLSDTPETESRGWDEKYDVNRICSYVVLKDREKGKQFVFMNTHFGFGDNCQTKSAELIYKYSRNFADLPVFVTGDFNMKNDSAGYKVMSGLFTDVNFVTAKDYSCTFHGYEPEKHPDYYIDYCFVNGLVTPKEHKIITDTFDGKYPSDHYALLFKLEV